MFSSDRLVISFFLFRSFCFVLFHVVAAAYCGYVSRGGGRAKGANKANKAGVPRVKFHGAVATALFLCGTPRSRTPPPHAVQLSSHTSAKYSLPSHETLAVDASSARRSSIRFRYLDPAEKKRAYVH